MSKGMFDKTLKLLKDLDKNPLTYHMEILPDEEGYLDKQCPDDKCLSKFKVFADDWEKKIGQESYICCPFCGNKEQQDNWFTTEQVEQAKKQAVDKVEAMIGDALYKDAKNFNRHQSKKSFVTMSMNVKGKRHFYDLPAQALEELQQKINCDNCGFRYEVVGSAYFCPCCGQNTADRTYSAMIKKIRDCVQSADTVRALITDKDVGENSYNMLLEGALKDIVVTVQRVCEVKYKSLNPERKLPINVFQRLDEGSALWEKLTGEGYHDWITDEQYNRLTICFQRRHLLDHQAGIVDSKYLEKSGDISYKVGQRIKLNEKEVCEFINVAEALCDKVLKQEVI